ncbi:MAG: single-stranded DNA-binding protein [Mycoplasmoidaceae bacterium]|nr:MAG: single-stranded DNA-binding protein [Mycoplasmoidaceae bacterium]
MNKVFLVGRLTADPILKNTSKGDVVNLTLAVRDMRNKDDTYFFNCSAFSNQATFIDKYLKKGDLVGVDGRLTRRSYTNKENKIVYVTEVMIDSIVPVGPKNKSSDSSNFAEQAFNKTVKFEEEEDNSAAAIFDSFNQTKGDNN